MASPSFDALCTFDYVYAVLPAYLPAGVHKVPALCVWVCACARTSPKRERASGQSHQDTQNPPTPTHLKTKPYQFQSPPDDEQQQELGELIILALAGDFSWLKLPLRASISINIVKVDSSTGQE